LCVDCITQLLQCCYWTFYFRVCLQETSTTSSIWLCYWHSSSTSCSSSSRWAPLNHF